MAKRILIMSDSHGMNSIVEKVLKREKPDMLIHAGDVETGWYEIEEWAGTPRTPVVFVKGNCDYGEGGLKLDRFFELNNHRFFVTHGHKYDARYGVEAMGFNAQANDCDIVIFGHTHQICDEDFHGIRVLNPGSIALPRDSFGQSYMIMTMEDNGDYEVEIKRV